MASKTQVSSKSARASKAVPDQNGLSAEAAAKVEEFVGTMTEGSEQMATTAETLGGTASTAEPFQAAFGDLNGRAKAAMEKGTKLMEELTELTKGNVEALVASSKIAARGLESLGQEAADYGRRSFEEASSTMKSIAEVRSPVDLLKLQSDYVRSAFDGWVAKSSKASETMVKLAGEIAEPITSQYSTAAARVKSVATF